MNGPSRIVRGGGAIDRVRMIRFSFDGRSLTGHPGDTVASALLVICCQPRAVGCE